MLTPRDINYLHIISFQVQINRLWDKKNNEQLIILELSRYIYPVHVAMWICMHRAAAACKHAHACTFDNLYLHIVLDYVHENARPAVGSVDKHCQLVFAMLVDLTKGF